MWVSWIPSFGDAGFLSFPFYVGLLDFLFFFSRSGGSGVLSHGAGFGLGFPWLSAHWDFRYIMIWHTIFFFVYYGLGDGATEAAPMALRLAPLEGSTSAPLRRPCGTRKRVVPRRATAP